MRFRRECSVVAQLRKRLTPQKKLLRCQWCNTQTGKPLHYITLEELAEHEMCGRYHTTIQLR